MDFDQVTVNGVNSNKRKREDEEPASDLLTNKEIAGILNRCIGQWESFGGFIRRLFMYSVNLL